MRSALIMPPPAAMVAGSRAQHPWEFVGGRPGESISTLPVDGERSTEGCTATANTSVVAAVGVQVTVQRPGSRRLATATCVRACYSLLRALTPSENRVRAASEQLRRVAQIRESASDDAGVDDV
ncbi:MAG: hypothetical protein JWM31_1514 [Solirubrobacterales bacterium]|nr:hypothetical protein [Solirubrobacterales bacterium]